MCKIGFKRPCLLEPCDKHNTAICTLIMIEDLLPQWPHLVQRVLTLLNALGFLRFLEELCLDDLLPLENLLCLKNLQPVQACPSLGGSCMSRRSRALHKPLPRKLCWTPGGSPALIASPGLGESSAVVGSPSPGGSPGRIQCPALAGYSAVVGSPGPGGSPAFVTSP